MNFNDLVTDLFKQYKVRIWMSAVNPASVVNPAGLMQIPPPSAIGPGAIMHSGNGNSSLPVGPGFGNSNYRSNEHYGKCSCKLMWVYEANNIQVAAVTTQIRAIMTMATLPSLTSFRPMLLKPPTACLLGHKASNTHSRCTEATVPSPEATPT